MVPDKNRAVFIRTSGGIPPVLISVDHVFLFLHPVIFIQTMFFTSIPLRFYSDRVFSNCYIKSATVISDLRLVIPLWFLSGPRFPGSVP